MRKDFRNWMRKNATSIALVLGGVGGGMYPNPIGGSYTAGAVIGAIFGLTLSILVDCLKWWYNDFKSKYWEEETE